MEIHWEKRDKASDGEDGIPTTPREMSYGKVRNSAQIHLHGTGEHVQYSVSGTFPFFILTYRAHDGFRLREQTVHVTLEEAKEEAQKFENNWFQH